MKYVDRDLLINEWLKYHNTNVKELVAKHPKEVLEDPSWFKLYPVTQEQHDEWMDWAKKYVKSILKLKGKQFDWNWGMIYLDSSPSVIDEDI